MRAKTAVKRLMKMCGCISPFLLAYLFLMNFNKTQRWPFNRTPNMEAGVSRPNLNHDDELVQPRPANVRQLAKYFPCSEESRIDAMETTVVLPNAEHVTKDTSKDKYIYNMAWRGNNDRLQELGIDLPSYFTRCLNVSEQHWNLSSLLIPDYFRGTTCAPPEPEFFDVNKWHTALASYMGSGNTWVRHIIEYISGVVTGSIYVDRDLLNEFKGEGQTENVMVIKTHELASRHRRTYNRAVILLRHPADTIMTLYNYERSRSHTGHVDKWMFEADDWKLFVQSNIFSWQRFYQSWTEDFSGPKFYLSYIRLQTDFNTEVLLLAQFLDISVTFQKLWCLKREMESGYHRNKAPWIDRGSFNKDMMKALNQSASLVKKAFTDVFNTSVEDLI